VYCKKFALGSKQVLLRFPGDASVPKALTTPPWSFVALLEADGIAAMLSLVSSDTEAETDVGRNVALARAR
jgi:hypothetical protein